MTIPGELLDDEERSANSEADLEKCLYMNVFLYLNKLSDDVQTGFFSTADCSEVKANGVAFLKTTRRLILLLELKMHNLTAHGNDLVSICDSLLRGLNVYPRDCLDAIQQLAGQLTLSNLRFGILTTYEYWWLVELCSDGAVKISPPYRWDDEGECSVLAMLHYAIGLAQQPVGTRKVTLPLLCKPRFLDGADGSDASESRDQENRDSNARQGGGGSKSGGSKQEQGSGKPAAGGGRQAAGGARQLGSVQYEFLRHLVEHVDRVTFQARLVGVSGKEGRLVAVKAYDSAEDRDREARRFWELQGLRAVPELLDARLQLEWTEAEERRVHALVLEWVGPSGAGGPQYALPPLGRAAGLPREALEQVREALVAMHRRGVAHGDVWGANLAWDPVARRAFVLDLSNAVGRAEAASAAEFAAHCQTDLQRVAELMEEDARARAGPPAPLVR